MAKAACTANKCLSDVQSRLADPILKTLQKLIAKYCMFGSNYKWQLVTGLLNCLACNIASPALQG